jgi:hypothetical protein
MYTDAIDRDIRADIAACTIRGQEDTNRSTCPNVESVSAWLMDARDLTTPRGFAIFIIIAGSVTAMSIIQRNIDCREEYAK